MRRYKSDPVLIKPCQAEFLKKWNLVQTDPPLYDRDSDPLYGILIRISEFDLSGVPRDSTANEKYKIGQKIERQARRRNSVFQANKRDLGKEKEGITRVNSAPDILQLFPCGRLDVKRVSFSIEAVLPPTYHNGLRPVSPNAKPILQKTKVITREPLSHMDYDMFAAWRRGSRLSIDIQGYKLQSDNAEINLRGNKEWKPRQGPFEMIKGALYNCISRHNRKTMPEEKPEIKE